jgi:hypothetical protein
MGKEITICDVPIVVEPGVNVIEAGVAVNDSAGERQFPVQLFRLAIDKKIAKRLPFVPSTTTPHVFSPVSEVRDSPMLLVYDHMGRLAMLYKRRKNSWDRYELFDEVVGRSVVSPSVRLRFNSEKTRTQFLHLASQLIEQSRGNVVNYDDVQEFVKILGRMRAPPVIVPVAVVNPVTQ